MTKFDHFNFLSPIYDHIFGNSSQSTIIELANIKPHHRVLDAGGGTGRVAALVSSLAYETVIVDSAFKMLQVASKKGIQVANANAEQLPMINGIFDRILMVDALHHVADQQKTLDELWRLLKSGGLLIVEEPDIRHWLVKLIALGEKLLLMRSHFLKPSKIKAMCSYIDVEKIEVRTEKGFAWIIISKRKVQNYKE